MDSPVSKRLLIWISPQISTFKTASTACYLSSMKWAFDMARIFGMRVIKGLTITSGKV